MVKMTMQDRTADTQPLLAPVTREAKFQRRPSSWVACPKRGGDNKQLRGDCLGECCRLDYYVLGFQHVPASRGLERVVPPPLPLATPEKGRKGLYL
ncbi:hypothetical protein CGRA01v4_13821 [Colletotrichum graminicola]|nr:hypothetical protein CGRA01v4_13821 [Colletotrichum graminicola]